MPLYIDALIDSLRANLWSPLGTPATVRYSFLSELPAQYFPSNNPQVSQQEFDSLLSNFSAFGAAQMGAVSHSRAMGSGLANCIKVPAEGFGESGGLSRTFFETGERVAESGDIASEELRQRGELP